MPFSLSEIQLEKLLLMTKQIINEIKNISKNIELK